MGRLCRVIVDVAGLTVVRANRVILDAVSIQMARADVIRLCGPNGAGKTTLLRVLAGVEGDYRGIVRIAGHDLRRERLAALQQVAFAPEDLIGFDWLTPGEFLHFAIAIRGTVGATRARIRGILEHVGVTGWTVPLGQLSRADRARVLMAFLALSGARVWLMDEFASALDVSGLRLLASLLGTHRATGGAAVVVAPDVPALQGVMNREVFLAEGRFRSGAMAV